MEHIMDNKTKCCNKCLKLKFLHEFPKNRNKSFGVDSWCKECKKLYRNSIKNEISLYGKNWKISNKEKILFDQKNLQPFDSYYFDVRTKHKSSNGYINLIIPNHPFRGVSNCVLEHRFVLEKHLGRFLEEHENVHHKNGIRDDNRIENLELWNKSQPSGQKLEDKIIWAIQLLTEHGYKVFRK